jgi:hypothetical protein
MLLPDWVAEDAPVHLLPALQAVLQGGQLPLQLIKAQTAPDGTFVLDLAWAGEPPSWRSQREAVFTLIGSIAETCTYVREQPAANGREFEIVTGQLPGDGPFGEHGHTLRLRISGT